MFSQREWILDLTETQFYRKILIIPLKELASKRVKIEGKYKQTGQLYIESEKKQLKVLCQMLREKDLDNVTFTGYNEAMRDRVNLRLIYLTTLCK